MKLHTFNQQGQAMITVLFIMLIGVLITTGAAYALLSNISGSSAYEVGELAYSAAESGVENALLRIIRDPGYNGETFIIDPSRTAQVTVSTASGILVTSTGVMGSVYRRVRVAAHYNNGILIIDSWNEVP